MHDTHDVHLGRHTSYNIEQAYVLFPQTQGFLPLLSQPIAIMCRQFYRHCRDCHELFPMPEPDMREPCTPYQTQQILKPYLENCPGHEVQVIRPPSGHGVKVCERCRKKNREDQRQRENAQKRARRAKLKRQKMTAGIGAGNVVWTTPKTWKPIVMDARLIAPLSPQPQRPRLWNILKIMLTTQALQYALHGCTSTATMTQDHVDISHHEGGVYSQSCQTFATTTTTTTSNILRPQGNCDDIMVSEMHDDTSLRCEYETETQATATKGLDHPPYQKHKGQPIGLGIKMDIDAEPPDEPVFQERKHDQVGLGISMNKDPEGNQNLTEAYSFDECKFGTELNKWSTVFDDSDDDDDDVHDAKGD